MRILHVVTAHTPEQAFGGPVRVAVNLASELISRGHDVELAAMSLGFTEPLPHEIDDVPLRLFQGRRVLPFGGFSGLTAPGLLSWARADVNGYDVVHAHLARDLATLPVARIAQSRGVPTVLQTHGMVDTSGRLSARALDAVATRGVLRSASALLYLTSREKRDLQDVASLDSRSLVRLPNGVPTQEGRRALPERPVVLFVSRLHPRKRPEVIPAIAASVRDAGIDATFVIAGPDEGARAGVAAAIAEFDVADRVQLLGGVSHGQSLDLMRGASLLLLPSVDEPFPMTVLEALSLGLPAVVTTSNGLAQDVADSGAGAATSPDVGPLSRAVVDLLDPESNEQASQAAFETARTRFSMRAVVDQLEAVYTAATSR